jgi:hypothetical protein
MGFSPFLGLLPSGDEYRSGLHTLGLQDVPVNVDAAGLLWQCAFHCKAEYIKGGIAPAAKLFQNAVMAIYLNLRWDALFVFAGADPEENATNTLVIAASPSSAT